MNSLIRNDTSHQTCSSYKTNQEQIKEGENINKDDIHKEESYSAIFDLMKVITHHN